MSSDPKVDAYIEKAAPFAQPILNHVRALVHRVCPEASEAIKWGFPHFVYRSKNLASVAAFKAHASINLWYSDDAAAGERDGMGQLGKLTSLADLPAENLLQDMIAASVGRIESGVKPARMEKKARPPLPVPPELEAAIAANPAAAKVWAGFAPGHVRDYAEWIGEAKRDETRAKRVAEAVEWIAEGKQRHWKYQR